MVVLVNRAKMTTSTTGTGTITLGSVVDGYQTFAAAGVSNGDSVRYVIEDGTSNWEIGSGTYTASGTTLSRTPSESSGGGSAINLSGDAIVFVSAIASDIQPVTYVSTTFTATAGQTAFTVSYTAGLVEVFLNGAKLSAADFTATNGTSVVLASGANVGDTVDVIAYGTVSVGNTYTQAQANALFVDVAGDTMTGDLNFGDNDKIIMGADSDLEIFHSGTASHIKETGTGNLKLEGSNIEINNGGGTKTYILASDGGAVQLRFDDNTKLATTSTGVDITGTVTTDGLIVSSGSSNQALLLDSTTGYNSAINYSVNSALKWSVQALGDGTNAFRFYNFTAGAESMRIDSSGNLLVGTTDDAAGAGNSATGISLRGGADNRSFFSVNQNYVMHLNRKGNDGNILEFAKDGTTVGSIGTKSSLMTIGTGTTGLIFDSGQIYPWNTTANAVIDASKDLGASGARFKDLYLSSKTKYQAAGGNQHSIGVDANDLIIRSETAGSETARFTYGGNLLVGGTTDRGVRICVGGTSSTARILPQTDNVGYIGQSSFRWQALYAVNGTVQTSDEREKTEIKPTTLGLEFIKDLRPVSYKWIDGEQQDKGKDKREHQGLIAQQVAKAVEKHGIDKNAFGGLDIQKTDKYDDFHGMQYDQLIAPLIKAIQEQQTLIESLTSRIAALEE
jgi:hypothetical protein